MISRQQALQIAREQLLDNCRLASEDPHEHEAGWFFAYVGGLDHPVGSSGLIVDKTSGHVFHLGSAFPSERDIAMYDRGYRFQLYDLVVIAVAEIHAAAKAIANLRPMRTVVSFANDTVWRIPTPLSRAEIEQRLKSPPAVFEAMQLYFHCEALDEAVARGVLQIQLHEHPDARRR